jgi:lysylphosphatidylglycerol synthetase-like protein (DUF2156 family)
MSFRLRPEFVLQILVFSLGVALAVYAADLNSWVLASVGSAAALSWTQEFAMPFELLWSIGLLVIGLVAGLVVRPAKLSRIRALVLLAGPFCVSALVGALLAVFMFGAYSSHLEAVFMFLYSVALPVGVLVTVRPMGRTESAA